MAEGAGPTGLEIRLHGLVQGVGFRPTVWRLASRLGLTGSVENCGEGVRIRAFGSSEALARFRAELLAALPPLARIARIEEQPLYEEAVPQEFRIEPSASGTLAPFVLPDLATCPECRREVFSPGRRRYLYPFTSCTRCGPRFSIVHRLPYDRERTSLAAFAPCPACLGEYRNPVDRRFHAQTIACPECGPKVWLVPEGTKNFSPLARAVELLHQGKILAVKGLGGFQLLADATCEETVTALRQRKRRPHKPLALMARDLKIVHRYCVINSEEEQALSSPAAPIVLLAAKDQSLPQAIAPGLDLLGFVLPYTPLHHLLLAEFETPLVFTSGNASGDPLCADNSEAVERLSAIADGFLVHDYAIVHPCDDSVVRFMAGEMRVLRRGRGMAPAPIPLPPGFEESQGILALGGELKSSFALIAQGQLVLSQYLGDLEQVASFARYQKELRAYLELFAFTPRCLAVDLHPEYLSTKLGRQWAEERGIKLVAVQHHHAHLGAVLAEHGHPRDGGPVLGVILDGLGYGADGAFWGGELLYGDYRSYRRLAHLKFTPLLGGTKAMREPWRNLAAQLWQAKIPLAAFPPLAAKPLALVRKLLESGLGSPLTSSCGRLFDAVAAAVGVCFESQTYEGQAAAELESLAWRSDDEKAYSLAIVPGDPWQLDPAAMWPKLLTDLERGVPKETIARRFHLGLARAWSELISHLARKLDCATVALSGGVFQNRLLLEAMTDALIRLELSVWISVRVPMNDGGLAVGQAVIAAAQEG
ncbi:MAG: carbamoyltransferase HypF [Methylohalobius sp.]|nr:carbamoyltransferase HypF [Methylohalobius sp.]